MINQNFELHRKSKRVFSISLTVPSCTQMRGWAGLKKVRKVVTWSYLSSENWENFIFGHIFRWQRNLHWKEISNFRFHAWRHLFIRIQCRTLYVYWHSKFHSNHWLRGSQLLKRFYQFVVFTCCFEKTVVIFTLQSLYQNCLFSTYCVKVFRCCLLRRNTVKF